MPAIQPLKYQIAPDASVEYRLSVLNILAVQGSHAGLVVNTVVDLARGASARQAVSNCLSFCQGLPVVYDPPGVDIYKDAVTTIAQGGDCADKSALLAAMLLVLREHFGYPFAVNIVWETHPNDAQDHVLVALSVSGAPALPLEPLKPGAQSRGAGGQRIAGLPL